MNKFLSSSDDKENSHIALVGAPFDNTSTFRSGAQFAPDMIRLYSDSIETYSPYQKSDLTEILFFDYNNIKVYPGDTILSLKNIKMYITNLVNLNKFPFVLGGEHLITLPIIEALKTKYSDIIVIQFDAHTDLRDNYEGIELSHATVMKRLLDLGGISLIQLGIRSGTKKEFEYAEHNNFLYKLSDIEKINKIIHNKNVYITVDMDVFDPAYVPGVGNPEAGGIDFLNFLNFVLKLNISNLIGIDIVELIPDIDSTQKSTIFTAKLTRELLLFTARHWRCGDGAKLY